MSRRHYLRHNETARAVVHERIMFWNEHYRVPIRKVFIKDTKSRWGSCSERGNLNFNYKLVFLAPELRDYVIVHELCHLKRFDHSPAFWAHVAETIPDYKVRMKRLRARLPLSMR